MRFSQLSHSGMEYFGQELNSYLINENKEYNEIVKEFTQGIDKAMFGLIDSKLYNKVISENAWSSKAKKYIAIYNS